MCTLFSCFLVVWYSYTLTELAGAEMDFWLRVLA